MKKELFTATLSPFVLDLHQLQHTYYVSSIFM